MIVPNQNVDHPVQIEYEKDIDVNHGSDGLEPDGFKG